MKKVMLACAGGMSSSILVKNLQVAAKKHGKDYQVWTTAGAAVENEIQKNHPDCILIGPQIAYMVDTTLKPAADSANIPLEVMDMHDYGTMDGEAILKQAERMMGE